MEEKIWRGLGVSVGRAAGKTWYLREFEADVHVENLQTISVEEEMARLTNDLTQYMLAVDRENSELAELYQPNHPAVLGMIARVSEAGLRAGIWTGVCGEAGGDALLAPFFAAVGIKELSMAAGSLPKVRRSLAN